MTEKLYGKYRARVVQNRDPLQRARLQVEAPEVSGPLWALPCLPDPDLSRYVPPPIGAQVWIEFERGDPDFPVWTGFFWG